MRAGCVICGDLFVQKAEISATPCGHTFHSVCLFQWLERSKSCPQCRHKSTLTSILRLYFDETSNEATQLDADLLHNQLDNQKFQVKLKDQEIKKHLEEIQTLKFQTSGLRSEIKCLELTVRDLESTGSALKAQLKIVDRTVFDAKRKVEEAEIIKAKFKTLTHVQKLVNETSDDISEVLSSLCSGGYTEESWRNIATLSCILKKKLNETIDEKRKFRDHILTLRSELKRTMRSLKEADGQVMKLTEQVSYLELDIKSSERENQSLTKKLRYLQESIISPSGNVKNSALQRLLSESPAPMTLKSDINSQQDMNSLTPEVVKRDSKKMSIIEPPLSKIETSSTLTLKSRNSTNIFKSSELSETVERETTFIPSYKNFGYDGLGGQKEVDVFPISKGGGGGSPYNSNPFAIKRRKALKVVSSNSCQKSAPMQKDIKNYFSNPFDDL